MLKYVDLANIEPPCCPGRTREQINEDWRRARTFLQEALAHGPRRESELFEQAAKRGIHGHTLWGELISGGPYKVLRETRPDRRDPGRVWKLLR